MEQRMKNMLGQVAMSKMGYWVDTPTGQVFVYDPKPTPEYPGQRVAPLTQLEQQGFQQASNLGQMQSQMLGQPRATAGQLAAGYQPGNLTSLANMTAPRPTMGNTPYQFDQRAITGMGAPRPDTGIQPEAFPGNWRTPKTAVDPIAHMAQPGWWAGAKTRDQINQALSMNPTWNAEWGPVPQLGYMRPKAQHVGTDYAKSMGWGPAQGKGQLGGSGASRWSSQDAKSGALGGAALGGGAGLATALAGGFGPAGIAAIMGGNALLGGALGGGLGGVFGSGGDPKAWARPPAKLWGAQQSPFWEQTQMVLGTDANGSEIGHTGLCRGWIYARQRRLRRRRHDTEPAC
jgi:hypothetical protein